MLSIMEKKMSFDLIKSRRTGLNLTGRIRSFYMTMVEILQWKNKTAGRAHESVRKRLWKVWRMIAEGKPLKKRNGMLCNKKSRELFQKSHPRE